MNSHENMWNKAIELVREGKPNQALFLFERLAADGEDYVFREIGNLYRSGGDGLDQNFSKALGWLRKGYYENDCADCAAIIGFMYYEGEGVKQDYIEALKYFNYVEDNNCPEAHFLAGLIEHNGLAGSVNIERAREWYEKSASTGNIWAARNLAVLDRQNGRYIKGLIMQIRCMLKAVIIMWKDESDRRLRAGF